MHRFVASALTVVCLMSATPVFAGSELPSKQNPLLMQAITPPPFDVVPGTASRRLVVVVPRSLYLQRPARRPMSARTEKIVGAVMVTVAFVGLLMASD